LLRHCGRWLIRITSHELWTHISQIVIDVENEIYILETVNFRGEYSK